MVEGRPDIAAFLARTGMNQSELARRLGTTSANVSKWVRGEGVPSYGICVSLLKMGMTQEELFGDEFPDITLADLKGMSPVNKNDYVSGTPEHEFDKKVEDSVIRLLGNLFVKK